MATKTTNKHVENLMNKWMEARFAEGHFPKVNFKREGGMKSYSLFDWVQVHARVAYVVHGKLVAAGYPQGVFSTRLRSKAFEDKARELVEGMTIDEVKASNDRFKTWID